MLVKWSHLSQDTKIFLNSNLIVCFIRYRLSDRARQFIILNIISGMLMASVYHKQCYNSSMKHPVQVCIFKYTVKFELKIQLTEHTIHARYFRA